MKKKTLSAKFASTASGFDAVITTDAIDRDGEVVVPAGMNSTEFETNPVLFWNHDYAQPVGRCLGLSRIDGGIKGSFQFAQRPDGFEGTYFPEFVASLVAQGIVRGVSIGYMPEEGGVRRASVDDRRRYGDRVQTVYSKWKLLEVSVAPLQANPEALVSAIRKGAVDADGARRWLGWQPPRTVLHVDPSASVRQHERIVVHVPIDVAAVARREVKRLRGQLWD